MKRCFFIGLALFACSMLPAQAQTSTDVNEGVRVTADASTGAQVLTWWGKAGRTYFVQQSYDLITWTYVPVVSDGGAAVDGLNFASTDNRQFWRLQFTDVSTGGLSGAAADFDGDGVSNLDELNSGTAPFNPDTDDDGFSDGTEALAGTNPTSADSNPVTDLSDEPLLSVTFLQSGNGQNSYEASSSVVQSEFYPDSWLVHIFRDLPGDTYTNRTVVNGSMPAVPDLPARPVAGSGSDVWGSSYSVGRDMLIYLLRIVNADTSGPGGETGAPVISHGSWLEGSAIKYKFTVQYPSMKDRTVRFMTQKTKQAVVYDPALPGFNYPSALTVTDSQVCTLMLPAEATETAETILQPDEAEDNTQTTATVAKALFITPAGDPVSSPVDGGTFNDPNNIPDGANEFTFSADTPGVLKLKFKVRKPDLVDQSATDQAKYTFDVDAIGGSVLTWPDANTGGKAKVDGEFLTATATFTGLPQNNTDFGTKTVRLKYDGNEVVETKFEVFYAATAKNHPGGDPSQPNWFNYYKQNEGGTDYGYNAMLPSSQSDSGVPGSTQLADNAYTGGWYISTTTNGSGRLVTTGTSAIFKYYKYFFGVVKHERQHAYNESTIGDSDGDNLPDSFEVNTSHTDPTNKFSAAGGGVDFSDSEIYAGGPIEEAGIKAADTAQDWANPGSNSKPKTP